MTAYIIYQFDPKTGFIGSTNRSNWPDDHPFLVTPNFIIATSDIIAQLTTTHDDGKTDIVPTVVQSGWSFILNKNGVPAVDENGNYIVTPPPHRVSPPDMMTYIFAGLVKVGHIDPTNVDADTLNSVNWSLSASGLPAVEGTTVIAVPVKTAVITSNAMVATTLGVHATKGASSRG